MRKFNKKDLNLLADYCGAIAGICTVLITQGVGDVKVFGVIGGIATVMLGVITQRPADKKPTTEDIEDKAR